MRKHREIYKYCLLVLLMFMAWGCSNIKYLPTGESLYTGSKITIKSRDAKAKERKNIRKQLEPLTRPKPNKKFLGLRFKLWAYNIAGHPKKEGSLRGMLKYKVGEPPVLASDVNLDRNVQILQSYLDNKGYFRSLVREDTTVRHRKMTAKYTVRVRKQYKIDSVKFEGDTSELAQGIATTMGESLLKKNDPYDLEKIKAERSRIDDSLKEKGFYFFNNDDLIVQADSSLGTNKVNLFIKVKPSIPSDAGKVYHINDIFIFSNYNLQTSSGDTIKKNATYFEGFYILDRRHQYKPRLFEQAMQFYPGDVYNRTDHNATISRLINLGIFKFVKNRFEVVQGVDSPKLNIFYYLSRLPKYSFRFEINAYTKSNNYTGSQITYGWHSRNTFKGGEIFSVNTTAAFEVQFGKYASGYNTYQVGIHPSLSFPRFLVPFMHIDTRSFFVPKTIISLGYDLTRKEKLYTMQSVQGSFGYNWKESIRKEHLLNPISIIYAQPAEVTQLYLDSAKRYPILLRAVDKQFILGTNYTFTYNSLLNNPFANGIYFMGNIDLSGNIAGLITGASVKENKPKQILGAEFSQYTKVEADFRFYRKTGPKGVWANRIDIGAGIPYGNSSQLPFIKQFYSGGNNSIRAFRSRSVGPGTFKPDSLNASLYDQAGDIKLELNTEFRFHLFSIFNAAVFTDAGNIWLYNNDTLQPGGKFSKDFLHEIAVGTGIGLRLDFKLLVFRLDVAFPLRKPYLPEGQRWVIDQIDFGSNAWRRDNLVYNLAIGYPF
jgi:outer membrane protein insertion porin family